MLSLKIGGRNYTVVEYPPEVRVLIDEAYRQYLNGHISLGEYSHILNQFTGLSSNRPNVVDLHSINVTDAATPTGDSISFTGHMFAPQLAYETLPENEEQIRLEFTHPESNETNTLFGGVVQTVDASIFSEDSINFTVGGRDYLKQLNGGLVSGVFPQLNPGDMVTDLIRRFAPTFPVLLAVDPITFDDDQNELPQILPKYWSLRTVGDCIQEVADAVFASWIVTPDREIAFVSLSKAGSLEAQELGLGLAPIGTLIPEQHVNGIRGFTWQKSTESIVNSLIVKNFYFRGPEVIAKPAGFLNDATFTGIETEGDRDSIILESPPVDLLEFIFQYRETPTVEWRDFEIEWDLDSTDSLDDLEIDTLYVLPASKEGQSSRARFRVETESMTAQYRYRYRPILVNIFPQLTQDIFSISEFADRETRGDIISRGTYERMISLDDLEFTGENPLTSLRDYGRQILDSYAWPVISGSFITDSDQFERHWRAGQYFYLWSPRYNLFDLRDAAQHGVDPQDAFTEDVSSGILETKPNVLRELTGPNRFQLRCWVTAVRVSIISPKLLQYEISFSNIHPGQRGQ